MLCLDLLQAREAAKYNWPWVKHGTERSIPMALNVWPCDLLIDMEKHGLQGNWRPRNWKGSSESEGIRGILGRRMTSSL